MNNTALKPIQIGYGDEKFVIYPRLISVAEEIELTKTFSKISDSDENKYQKIFDLCKKALGEYSIQPPVRIIKENGKQKHIPLIENAETASEAIENFFAEQTPHNERIMREAYFSFISQQSPSAILLES